MKESKQVDKCHYEFNSYMGKDRWASVWHQLSEALKLRPDNVLEIGPGPGMFKCVAALFGLRVETLDLDPELAPDHIGSATALPFEANTFDLVCAFQMLEHLPYEQSLLAFSEMVRISKGHVVISLPDCEVVWRYKFYVPKIGEFDFLVRRPSLHGPKEHVFDGEHYWEINKKDYSLKQVITDFSRHARLLTTYRVSENPYHRFFIFAV